jgi:hypothetical protein
MCIPRPTLSTIPRLSIYALTNQLDPDILQ